jgi:hypothetical protein
MHIVVLFQGWHKWQFIIAACPSTPKVGKWAKSCQTGEGNFQRGYERGNGSRFVVFPSLRIGASWNERYATGAARLPGGTVSRSAKGHLQLLLCVWPFFPGTQFGVFPFCFLSLQNHFINSPAVCRIWFRAEKQQPFKPFKRNLWTIKNFQWKLVYTRELGEGRDKCKPELKNLRRCQKRCGAIEVVAHTLLAGPMPKGKKICWLV